MKLVYCLLCKDTVRLVDAVRECACGETGGLYLDGINAVYWGGRAAVPLGFANASFVDAVLAQPRSGLGREFTAFVIARECDTMRAIDEDG